MKCWDAEAENRPNAKELYQILKKLEEKEHKDDEIRIKTYTQAIYASRLLNFKNLPEPINSSDLSSFQFNSDLIEINQEGNDLNDES
uniref:Serine-threonine/tyrosine-protein kinase catalytic domain-containing protein n=1 Tax=Rhizophagus irregularis (strain DAOM 181602 / DAOM 197198 / MUCL 43194) TaxID=747089 RepID=U9U6N2_RHIID